LNEVLILARSDDCVENELEAAAHGDANDGRLRCPICGYRSLYGKPLTSKKLEQFFPLHGWQIITLARANARMSGAAARDRVLGRSRMVD